MDGIMKITPYQHTFAADASKLPSKTNIVNSMYVINIPYIREPTKFPHSKHDANCLHNSKIGGDTQWLPCVWNHVPNHSSYDSFS